MNVSDWVSIGLACVTLLAVGAALRESNKADGRMALRDMQERHAFARRRDHEHLVQLLCEVVRDERANVGHFPQISNPTAVALCRALPKNWIGTTWSFYVATDEQHEWHLTLWTSDELWLRMVSEIEDALGKLDYAERRDPIRSERPPGRTLRVWRALIGKSPLIQDE